MKSVIRRIRRLEVSLKPVIQPDCERNPRTRLRIVARRPGPAPHGATPRCTRTLSANGDLTEVVQLYGSGDDLAAEELDQFVATFPVRRAGSGWTP